MCQHCLSYVLSAADSPVLGGQGRHVAVVPPHFRPHCTTIFTSDRADWQLPPANLPPSAASRWAEVRGEVRWGEPLTRYIRSGEARVIIVLARSTSFPAFLKQFFHNLSEPGGPDAWCIGYPSSEDLSYISHWILKIFPALPRLHWQSSSAYFNDNWRFSPGKKPNCKICPPLLFNDFSRRKKVKRIHQFCWWWHDSVCVFLCRVTRSSARLPGRTSLMANIND